MYCSEIQHTRVGTPGRGDKLASSRRFGRDQFKSDIGAVNRKVFGFGVVVNMSRDECIRTGDNWFAVFSDSSSCFRLGFPCYQMRKFSRDS